MKNIKIIKIRHTKKRGDKVLMNLKKSEYFKICGSAWNFFKESLPTRKDQTYWDDVIRRGEAITRVYKNTQYYEFATAQVMSYINELEAITHRMSTEKVEN